MPSKKDTDNQKQITKSKEEELSLEKELLQILSRRAGISGALLSDQQDIANVIRDQAKHLKFQRDNKDLILKTTREISKIAADTYTINKNEYGTSKLANKLSKDQLSLDKRIQILNKESLELSKAEGELNADLVVSIEMQVKEAAKLKKEIEGIEEKSKKVSDHFGVKSFTGLSSFVKSIPGLKALSDPFEDAAEAAREAAIANVDGAKKINTFMVGVKSLGKSLSKALGPLALLAILMDSIKKVDKQAGEMAKNFGISHENALGLHKEASQVASYSDDILVNSEGILKAQTQLNKHFGSAVKFSSEMAANFDSIQKRTKLSDEAMGIFAQFALKSDKSIKEVLKDTHKVVLEQNQQHKLGIGVKEVQEGIAKTSKSLQLTYKFNTKELANSVIEAKKLGVNLGEVEAIAGHLLDFESSIQSELQAELLLGKEINLERARSLALEGDMAGVAKEVLKNKAIMKAFDTKNVIAQEAAAKALGMNREQLASMVMEQKELELLQKKLGHGIENMSDAQKEYNRLRSEGMSEEEAAKKLGDESLAQQLESVSMAEKMEGATKKVQELFIGLATDVLPLIMMALKPITATIQFMTEGIRWFIDGLKEANPAAIAIGATLATLAIPAVITAISSIFGAFAMLGPLGVPLAGIAVMGLMSKLSEGESKVKSMKDGMINPQGGMVVKGPKGSIQLDRNDSIVAGTELGGGGNTNLESNKIVQEQLQETKTQNQLLSQLIGNTSKLKDLDNVGFYEIQ